MATAMDELVVKLEDVTECPVCLEQFKEPRMLPCQHSFCTECLEGALGTEHTLRCPYCNKDTPVPNGVRELPVDFRANSWLEILSEHEKAKAAREAEAVAAQAAEENVLGAEAAVPQDAFQLMSLDEHCPVCEEIPTVSKNLSCGHSLCKNCVQFLLPVGGDTLHCPTCSRQTRVVAKSNTHPGTSPQRSQPDNSSDNEPLYQSLYELLGGRSHQPASTSQHPNTATRAGLHRPQPSVPLPRPPGATPEGVNFALLLPMLELLTRAATAKGPPPSPPNTPRPSFSSAPAPALQAPAPRVPALQAAPAPAPQALNSDRKPVFPPSEPDTSRPSGQPQTKKASEQSRLVFHTRCGKNAVVSHSKLAARRKKSYRDVLVLTSRHLKPNELFAVRLDRMVDKWAGSIKIGVTTHSPTESEIPAYLSQLGSGTWYMGGRTVRNQSTIFKTYEKGLDDLKVGDCVGVQRRKNGDLHFYINGVDLGVAASNVPAAVYGVVSLFGEAEQVTIIDTPAAPEPELEPLQKVSLIDRLKRMITGK